VSNAPVTAVVAFIPVLVVKNGLTQASTPFPAGAVFVGSERFVGAALDMSRVCREFNQKVDGYLTRPTPESQQLDLPMSPPA
jgi:hypothetical protein